MSSTYSFSPVGNSGVANVFSRSQNCCHLGSTRAGLYRGMTNCSLELKTLPAAKQASVAAKRATTGVATKPVSGCAKTRLETERFDSTEAPTDEQAARRAAPLAVTRPNPDDNTEDE